MVMPVEKDDLVIEATGLTKVFKDFWGRPKAKALNGIDLRIRRGQIFGLLGPNGSGKSTTVKLILGLLYATRGSLRVLHASPRDVRIKRRIGYLPEESYLYRYLTATETLEFFGALFGLVPEERRQRTEQLLEMVGLANSRQRPVGEFSKGMARRIGLAQALINDPDLVILDEPTAGLDPIGCREVKDVIKLLASRGKTVLLCSHLLADVEDVCDEIAVLYGGKIRTEGRLQDILTVQDRTRIETPQLQPEAIAKARDVLGHYVPADMIRIDRPRMNLEDFFLDVVRTAKNASVHTAGAQTGGRIAAYLQAETGAGAPAASQRLVAAMAKRTAAIPLPAAPAAPAQAELPTTDAAKLAAVAAPAVPPPVVPQKPNADEPAATREEANKRLASLLEQVPQKKG